MAPRHRFVALVLAGCATGALCAMALRSGLRSPIELTVKELIRVRGGQPVLVLVEKDGVRALPIPLGTAEAALIEGALHGRGGLSAAALEALGGRVLRASIDQISRGRGLRGHLTVVSASRELRIEAGAGEALAIALQAGAPLVADPDVLEEAGVTPADLHGRSARNVKREAEPAPVLGI